MVRNRAFLRGTIIALVACLLLVLPVTAIHSPTAAVNSPPAPADDGVPVDPQNVLMHADIQPDGSAQWRVEYRVRLDDANTSESFAEVSEAVETNATRFTNQFESGMRGTLRAAERETGRSMALNNLSIRTSRTQLPQRYGVVAYTFEWRGFAAVDGDTLRVGNALDGMFLDEETTLLFSWPEEYRATNVSPTASERRSDAVVWNGPIHFAPDEPQLAVERVEPVPEETASPTTRRSDEGTADVGRDDGNDDGTGETGDPTDPPLGLVVGGIAVLAAVAGGARLVGNRGRAVTSDAGGDELRSTEERVLAVIECNGGRVKQREVTAELGWSAARTSQVVGELQSEGAVEVFRVGRENVLALPDEVDT